MKIGTILFTKDGRVIGNAIITGVKDSEYGLGKVYEIETDFGNKTICTESEILEVWHDPSENKSHFGDDYDRWKDARLKNINEEYHCVECENEWTGDAE